MCCLVARLLFRGEGRAVSPVLLFARCRASRSGSAFRSRSALLRPRSWPALCSGGALELCSGGALRLCSGGALRRSARASSWTGTLLDLGHQPLSCGTSRRSPRALFLGGTLRRGSPVLSSGTPRRSPRASLDRPVFRPRPVHRTPRCILRPLPAAHHFRAIDRQKPRLSWGSSRSRGGVAQTTGGRFGGRRATG